MNETTNIGIRLSVEGLQYARSSMAAVASGTDRVTAAIGRQATAMQQQAAAEDAARARAEQFVRVIQQEAETLGFSHAQMLRYKAAKMGVAAESEAAIAKIEQQSQRLGMSAKATTAAMRQLPAQFTDIMVSLAGGQSPTMVLLQQGGQIHDMFGGIGPAARAMGTYVMGAINPMTLALGAAAAAGYVLYQSYESGRKEAQAFTMALQGSGSILGATTGQLNEMAKAISGGDFTRGEAAAALAQIAASGQIAAGDLKDFTAVALGMERYAGQSVETTAKKFAELGKSPSEATLKLSQDIHHLTAAQYEQIVALEKSGDKSKAASLAQQAYADSVKNTIETYKANMGYLETAMDFWAKKGRSMWDAILGWGRSETGQERIAAVQQKLAAMQSSSYKWAFGMSASDRKAEIAAAQEELRILLLKTDATEKNAEADAKRKAAQDAGIAAMAAVQSQQDKGLTQQQQMSKALAEYHRQINDIRAANPNSALLDPAKVAAGEKAIRDQYKAANTAKDSFVAGRDAAQEWARYVKDFGQATLDAEGKTDHLTKTQQKLIEYLGSSAYINMDEPARQLALETAYAAIAQEQLNAALKAEEEAQKVAMKVAQDRASLRQKEADGIQAYIEAQAQAAAASLKSVKDRVESIQDEERAVQLAATMNITLAEAVERVAMARLKEQQAKLQDGSEAWQTIQKEIDAREKLIGLVATKATREAAQAEWQRTFDQVQQSLSDALMAGGKSGLDYIKGMFRSLVLRPIVNFIVNPIAGAITGALGFSGAANAATSAGGEVGGLGSLFGALGTGMGAGFSSIMGGGIGGWLSASGSLLTSGTGAGFAAGAGMLAGPLMAIAGIASLLKSLDKSGTPHGGGIAQYSANEGLQTSNIHGAFNTGFGGVVASKDGQDLASGIAEGVTGLLDSIAKTFGKSGGYQVATGFAGDGVDPFWGALRVNLAGKDAINWNDANRTRWAPREFGSAAEYQAAVAKDVRDYLITQTPDWADAMLKALGDAPTIEKLASTVTEINAVAAALDVMGRASKSFSGLADEATTALIKALGGAQGAVAKLASYYDAYYTDAERAAIATAKLKEDFAKIGVAMPTDRNALRALIDAATAAGDTALAAKLIELAKGFADITKSADDAAKATADAAKAAAESATNAALQALQKSVDAQKGIIQTQLDAWTTLSNEARGIWSWLDNTVSSLRQTALAPTVSMAAGQQSLNAMLSAAMATGALPDQTALERAVSGITTGINAQGVYGNEDARRFATLALAGQLSTLEGVAGKQLTESERAMEVAKQQLGALDETLKYWEQQVALSKDGITATLSVADAVTALQEALKPGSTGKGKNPADSGGGNRGYYAPSGERVDLIEGVGGTAAQIYGAKVAGAIGNARNNGNTMAAAEIWLNSTTGRGLGSADAAAKAAMDAGATDDEIKRLEEIGKAYQAIQNTTGHNPSAAELEDELKRRNIPAFASGGWHSGGWAMVGENGPELAYMPPAQIYTANQTNTMLGGLGNTARLEAQVSQLLERIASLEATVAQGVAAQQASADTLAAVTQGNALVTQAAPTF